MVQEERLWHRLMELSAIGAQSSGGITRLSFSEDERKAKALVSGYMREAGLEVREDAIGNLIGRKEGTDPHAPIVLTGSHIDSVYNGGNFDGPLGVLSAIEALHIMKEDGVLTKHPIEVIAFTDEEGARFGFGMIGSRGLAGTLNKEDLSVKDQQGISLAEAMETAEYPIDQIGKAVREPGSVKAYIELHIEQGKVLERENLPVGIVSGIAGPLWMKWTLEGAAGHAGTTPMNLRQDALAAAAEVMLMIEREAQQVESGVATIGQLQLFPGGINIIPGKVEFSVDLRHTEQDARDQMERTIREKAAKICEDRGVTLRMESLQRVAPVPCSPVVRDSIHQACQTIGLTTRELPSGAGHDGMQLSELCPIGMIFVRSREGISHNPKEWSSPEDCAAGAHVLYHSLLALAEE